MNLRKSTFLTSQNVYKKFDWKFPLHINAKRNNFFEPWYVLNVRAGREQYIKEYIDYYLQLKINTVIFTREIVHKKGNKFYKTLNLLFPGYIFVYKEIHFLYNYLKKRLCTEYIRPVAFNEYPSKVNANEMKLLLTNTNSFGTFLMSHGIKKGKEIVIIDGPLKNIKGNILFINKRKRKAKVRIELFKCEMYISLGFDIVKLR